jgi:hypothetical protein
MIKVPDYIKRCDALVIESQQLKIKGAPLLEQIRKERQSRPLRIGKR